MSAQDAGPVVVCCATAEAAAIRDALAELSTEGHSLDIVEGVEEDPRRLVPVIERLHGDGLYVLCRSASLGRDTIERLREILLTHHVPFGRTVTVATTRPRELVERIRASVVRSGTRKPSRTTLIMGVDGSPGTKPRIPQLAPAPIARSRGSRAPIDDAFENALTGRQPAISLDEPIAEDDGSDFDPPTIELPDRKTREAAMKPLSEQDSAAISLTDAAIELLDDHDVDSSLAGFEVGKLDFSDLERADSGRILIAPFPRVPVRSGNTSISPAPTAPSIPPPPSIPAPPMARASVPEPPPRILEPPRPAPQQAFPAPLPSSSSTVAVGPAIAPPISSPGTFPSMSSMSAPVGAAASGGPSASASALGDGQPTRSAASVLAAVGLVAVAIVVLAIVWAVKKGDDEAPKTAASGSAASSSTPGPGDAPGDSAVPADAAEPPAESGDPPQGDDAQPLEDEAALPLVAVALEERKVRALDILLVQSKSAGPMTHDKAATYCQALDLAGLSGWRLPEVGELSSLSEAGMIGPSVYWSRTAGDTFGDTHFAWNGGKRRVQPQLGTCRVLCVRPDQAMP